MPTPRITSITPATSIAGGRIAIHGSGFPIGLGLPSVHVGDAPARVVFASGSELDVVLDASLSGELAVRVGGSADRVTVHAGTIVATGLHQVDSPVVDSGGTLYLTYSGTRGQQVPVSIFRVPRGGTRESFSAAVTNPTSMAISPDGQLFVSSRFEGAVYRLDPDGSAEVFASDLGIACGLAFAEDGTLFVGDRSGTIFEVASGGQARTLATLPASVAAFHLARGADGLYVASPTLSPRDAIYRVSFAGEVSVVHSGFGRPQGLAFDPDGELYVVEALAGVSGVYRVPRDGTPELVVSGPRLVGVAFDADTMIVCSADTAYRVPRPR